jgi:hypothetical protein
VKFQNFWELCGKDMLQNVVIVTTMWGKVTPAKRAARKMELATNKKFFKSVIDKQALLLRHDNMLSTAQSILHHIIYNRPRVLHIQDEVTTQGMDIS